MKLSYIWICSMIVNASLAYGQLQSDDKLLRTAFILSGGFAVPTQPVEISENWKTGLTVGLGIEIPKSQVIRLLISAEYTNCEIKEDAFNRNSFSSYAETGGRLHIVHIALSVKAHLSTEPKYSSPYFLVGIGYYFHYAYDRVFAKEGDIITYSFTDETAFSAQTGVGIEIPLTDNLPVFFFQMKYMLACTEDELTSNIPITAGIKLRL